MVRNENLRCAINAQEGEMDGEGKKKRICRRNNLGRGIEILEYTKNKQRKILTQRNKTNSRQKIVLAVPLLSGCLCLCWFCVVDEMLFPFPVLRSAL